MKINHSPIFLMIFSLVCFIGIFCSQVTWVIAEENNTKYREQESSGQQAEQPSPLAYSDPFQYGEFVETYGGIVPNPGTYAYIKGESGAINSLETTYNFDYGVNYSNIPQTKNIIGGSQNFVNGYHESQNPNNPGKTYDNVLTKKSVQPTANPYQFDVTLDIIGGLTEISVPTDIVFVIDKSGSMAFDVAGNNVGVNHRNSRWNISKRGLTKFVDELLVPEKDVRMGVVTFGSDGTSSVWAEQANYGDGSRFTTDPSSIMNNPTITENPENSGTPTYMGIELAAKTLADHGRQNAKKYIITLTDGVSTFYPKSDYGIQEASKTESRGKVIYSLGKQYFSGTGNEQTQENIINSYNGLVRHLNNRAYNSNYYPGIETVGHFGVSLGANGEYISKTLTAIGSSGKYNAASEAFLNEALQTISERISSYKNNIILGSLTDPMSSYVTFQGDHTNIKFSALELIAGETANTLNIINESAASFPSYAQEIKSNTKVSDGVITSTNINLGGDPTKRTGIRINYTVELKEEYRDGKFYLTNGPTFLSAQDDDWNIGFAVPVVRVPTFDLVVEKIWEDENNRWQTRKDITLHLEAKTSHSGWQKVPNQEVTIPSNAEGEELIYQFLGLMEKDETGEFISYRVIETFQGKENVPGYDVPIYSSNEVTGEEDLPKVAITNKLLKKAIEFDKTNAIGDPLKGATFTIRKVDEEKIIQEVTSNPKVTFEALPIGKYEISEIKSPEGYQLMSPFIIEIKPSETESGELRVVFPKDFESNEAGNIEVINKLNDFLLRVIKEDNNGSPVSNVTFELKDEKNNQVYSLVADEKVENHYIVKGLRPGSYTLVETKAAEGFIPLKESIKIVITEDGKVIVNEGKEDVLVSLGEENTIQLKVINIAKSQMPVTGGQGYKASFIITSIIAILIGMIGSYYVYRNRKGAK